MKKLPFDLEKALAGEPVVTRDGRKVEQIVWLDKFQSDYNVFAVVGGGVNQFLIDGSINKSTVGTDLDLFMKPKTITVNGFDVPTPLVEAESQLGRYFVVNLLSEKLFTPIPWANTTNDMAFISRGIAHSTKEAAIAHAKAMLGIDPEEELR